MIAARSGAGRTTVQLREHGRGGFWAGLERYFYRRVEQLPVRWEWVGTGVVVGVIGASIVLGYYTSPTLGSDRQKIIRAAAARGDYELARKLYEEDKQTAQVLGAQSDLEELVYPERRLEREIVEWREKLSKYPGNRDILLYLTKLYIQAGDREKAREYWEEARVLDPNGEAVKEMGKEVDN